MTLRQENADSSRPARIVSAAADGPPSAELAGEVRAVIDRGGLVALPTETVYGLAADATNAKAVARIYAAKRRPRFNPLISHLENLEAAARHGLFDPIAQKLAEAFWPGPLTLVVPKRADSPIADIVTAGLDTVALRVPGLALTRGLIAACGRPLAAPSANLSGRLSATTAAAVAAQLGSAVSLIVDAGPCPVGVESTIVAATGGSLRLLRPGGIARSAIEAVAGAALSDVATDDTRPEAPGMLRSHYAPRARLRLDIDEVRPGEALLGFGLPLAKGADRASAILNLSESGDLIEAAANLFSHLNRLDETGAAAIAVMALPGHGLGEAIRDRPMRAAAPRPAD